MKDAREAFEHPDPQRGGTSTIYVKSADQICEMLSPERIQLLIQLLRYEDNEVNISDVAHILHRKQEAISRDLSILEKYRLVSKTRDKQKVYPKALCNSITIELAAK